MFEKDNFENMRTSISSKDFQTVTAEMNPTTSNTEKEEKQEMKETYPVFPKSAPSSVNVNPKLITVIFNYGDGSFATAFDTEITTKEIKRRLCNVLELKEEHITLYNNDIEAKDSQTLTDFGGQPYGKVTLKVTSTISDPTLKDKVEENIPTIDVITVHNIEGVYYRDIIVGIENQSIQKQWFGGYQNKQTGIKYHNAYTQTMPKKKKVFELNEASGDKIPLLFERDTQTPLPLVHKTIDTAANKATQMYRSDFYLCSKNDKILIARPYVQDILKQKFSERHVKSAIIIQRSVRKWIMRRRLTVLISTQIENLRKYKEDRQKIFLDQEDKDRLVIIGAAFPVKRDDFYALFLRVEKWWKKEWKQICDNKRSEAKKAATVMLVEKETELLEAIEKHKTASKAECLKKQEMHFLEQTSRPVLFRTSTGHLFTIDYIETQNAREFKEIYSALARKDVLPKERVELLLTVKKLFESHYMEYEYAQDLISLIDREIQLIGIGFKLKDLKGLESRIEQLFLNFLHQPEFNPSAIRYKKPNLPKTIHQTFRCTRCLKLLPTSKYTVHVRMRSFDQCKSCTWMQNIAHERVDMSPYLKLLHQVQNSEMQKCCYSAICFILQPIGIGYLTNVIWHGHSAISECSDISKLQHVRWLQDVEWAPWNTILLTDQEAKLHESIPDVCTFYGEQFVEKIWQRHILARKRFIQLLMMDHDIRSSGQWSNVTDSGVFLHPSHAERMSSENTVYDMI